MRGEDVLDGLRGHAFHLLDDLPVVLFEFVVDQDDAFAGDINCHIAAVPDDLVEVVFHLVDFQVAADSRGLRVGDPGAEEEDESSAKTRACCAVHWE